MIYMKRDITIPGSAEATVIYIRDLHFKRIGQRRIYRAVTQSILWLTLWMGWRTYG